MFSWWQGTVWITEVAKFLYWCGQWILIRLQKRRLIWDFVGSHVRRYFFHVAAKLHSSELEKVFWCKSCYEHNDVLSVRTCSLQTHDINQFFISRTIEVRELLRHSVGWSTLRKHAYWNLLKILSPKNENFLFKKIWYFHISAQNIDCGYLLEPPRWGGSNEYPQSMFLSRNKKNNVYPCTPQFYYIKVGFKGVKII